MLASIPAACATSSSSGFSDFTRRQLRIAWLRAAIVKNEIAAMGVALKAGLVSPEHAISHLIEIGAGGLLTWESSQ
jgi:hypothetical protein